MVDAYEHILLWNEKVNKLKEARSRLQANDVYLPNIEHYLVNV